MQNKIGDIGESVFGLALTDNYLFMPKALGEKWPVSDYYVELIGTKDIMFFIVQIKSTTLGTTLSGNLKVKPPKKKLHQLNAYCCPTYLAGVDVLTKKVYMKSINKKKRRGISSLPTNFELNPANLKLLYEDVKTFWEKSNIKKYKNSFKHKL